MLVFVYDNSFEGLLTAVYDAYYHNPKPQEIIAENEWQANLLDTYITIKTDPEKSHKVYEAIKKKISKEALRQVYHVYLSETKESGTIIFNYLQLGFKLGSKVNLNLMEDRVFKMHSLFKKVATEKHRMLGFVRFQLVGSSLYYAPISPDYNILPLIGNHFAERMADQNWMIHDLKREISIIYNTKEWMITPAPYNERLLEGEGEVLYQQLWKSYYKSISIKERKNIKLQKRFMPVRYWEFLTEKK